MLIRRLPPVDAEALEAVRYYKAIDPKLGIRLTEEFEAALGRISHFPHGWKSISAKLRQCGLKGFPYVVIYAVIGDEIIVVALANTHRMPGYWMGRLALF